MDSIKEYFKKFFKNFTELVKDIPADYEAIKKKNEMEREKINKEYEEFKENNKSKQNDKITPLTLT